MAYSPSAVVAAFSTEPQLTVTLDATVGLLRVAAMPYAVTLLCILLLIAYQASTALQRARRRDALIVPVLVGLTMVVAVGLAAVGLQEAAFTRMRGACADFVTTATEINHTIGASGLVLGRCVDEIAEFDPAVAATVEATMVTVQADVVEYSQDIDTYTDQLLAAIGLIDLSLVFVYMAMLLAFSAAFSAYAMMEPSTLKRTAGHALRTLTLAVLIMVVTIVAVMLLVVVRTAANFCTGPLVSVLDYFDITSPLLQYYLQCAINPAFNGTNTIITNINSVTTAVAPYVQYLDQTSECYEFFVVKLPAITVYAHCDAIGVSAYHLVDTVCVDSYGALVMLYLAFTMLLAIAAVTEFSRHYVGGLTVLHRAGQRYTGI